LDGLLGQLPLIDVHATATDKQNVAQNNWDPLFAALWRNSHDRNPRENEIEGARNGKAFGRRAAPLKQHTRHRERETEKRTGCVDYYYY
jgi:hypothetical protein